VLGWIKATQITQESYGEGLGASMLGFVGVPTATLVNPLIVLPISVFESCVRSENASPFLVRITSLAS